MRFAHFASLAALLASPSFTSAQFVVNVDTGGPIFSNVLGIDDGALTPDGRYGVVRMNAFAGSLRVYDMQTGLMLEDHGCGFLSTGENQDSVAATDERAIAIGRCAFIGDLTAVGTPQFIIGHHELGGNARDVAITPDGTIAAVRGGKANTLSPGGLFLFDLASGGLLANTPGDPGNAFSGSYSTGLDTVAVTDDYAVFLSVIETPMPVTRVTIFSLKPAGGGAPVIAFESKPALGGGRDLNGAASDLAITPDGKFVAVRAEFEIGFYSLSAQLVGPVWIAPPKQNPGPLANATMDTIVATNSRVATITRWSIGGVGTQVDVFDFAGNQVKNRIAGDPHDLAVTPAGDRLVVRTHLGAALYDLGLDPAAGMLPTLATTSASSTHTGYAAGLDSLEVTSTRAAMLFRVNSTTDVRIYDISQDTFALETSYTMPEAATDLTFTPDETRLILSADSYLEVFDLRTGTLVLTEDIAGSGPIPWSDGVVADDSRALVWGVNGSQVGWVATVDLFSDPVAYCEAQNNSTGAVAHAYASGSASVGSNNLNLWATGLPASVPAMLVYGSGQGATPFGHGTSCVAGTVFLFPLGVGQANGMLGEVVDVTGAPSTGGAITAGTTWNFQFYYRDGKLRRTTDALAVTFLP